MRVAYPQAMRATSFRSLALGVAVYAVAMSYLEAAVVVDLRAALGQTTGDVFPVSFAPAGNLGWKISGWTGTDNDASMADSNMLTMPASDHAVSVVYKTYLYLPLIIRSP